MRFISLVMGLTLRHPELGGREVSIEEPHLCHRVVSVTNKSKAIPATGHGGL
jgi:hypothetical protein